MIMSSILFFVFTISFVSIQSQRSTANATYWSLHGDMTITPKIGLSVGQINLHEALEMEFDFRYQGKSSSTQYENVFRIGYAGEQTCTEAGTRYPSMWIDSNNQFQISLSDVDSCWDVYSPWIPIEKWSMSNQISYHMVIRFNQTWRYASLKDSVTGETNVFINEEHIPTTDVLYTDMDLWFSDENKEAASGVTLSGITIRTWDPVSDGGKPDGKSPYGGGGGGGSSSFSVSGKHSHKWSSSDSSDSHNYRKHGKGKGKGKGKWKGKSYDNKAFVQNKLGDDVVDDGNIHAFSQKHNSTTPVSILAIFIGAFVCMFIIMVVAIGSTFFRKEPRTQIKLKSEDCDTDEEMEMDGNVNETTEMI